MFNSLYLDVIIALAVVFALLSIIASSASEWLAQMLQLRGKLLRDAILNMFDGANGSFGASVLANPLIQSGSLGTNLPSYLESSVFAGAVVSALQQRTSAATADASATTGAPTTATPTASAIDSLNHAASKQVLGALLQRAENNVTLVKDASQSVETTAQKFEQELATWFNATMDRMSGVYKRQSQKILFVIGVVVAVGLNVDTIFMTNTFLKVQGVRETVVAQANAFPVPPPQGDSSATGGQQALAMLASLQVPMGWGAAGPQCPACNDYLGWTSRVGGWLLTAIAMSFGAPFWFDLLGRLMNLRSAGTKPKSA